MSTPPPEPAPTTVDTLWRGRIALGQPARGHGYRFNLDPVYLAAFASPGETVVDLGCGVGIIGILMLRLGKARRVVGVEAQEPLARLCRENAQRNGLGEHLEVLCGDLRSLPLPRGTAVVFNPPYVPSNHGRKSPDQGRDLGRREVRGTLADFVTAAAGIAPEGPVAAIIPAPRGPELEALFARQGLGTVRIREVRPRAHLPAKHWLIEATGGAPRQTLEAPLVVHAGDDRTFTDEVRSYVDGPA